MVNLTQLLDGGGAGAASNLERMTVSQDTEQSSGPLQPASHTTSEASIDDQSEVTLASVFPNGRYDPRATQNSSRSTSSPSSPSPNTTQLVPPRHLGNYPRAARGRGRGLGGSGRQYPNNRAAHDRLRQNGPHAKQLASMGSQAGTGSAGQMARLANDWGKYRNVLMTMSHVPADTTTWDLWSAFSPWSTIVFIDIDENAKGDRTGMAKIRFDPPPKDAIQPGSSCQITVRQRKVWIIVDEIIPSLNEGAIRSPLSNRVPSYVVFKPSRLTFGIMIEPTKLMSMRSVSPVADDVLSAMVDFRQRKLKITFPVFFEDKSRPEPPSFGCSYRLEAKFDAITKIYRVSNAGTKAVVISLAYPPRFFRKKVDVQRTHDAGRLNWADTDLWARAVEITHDLEASKKAPASLEDTRQYIDLGRWTTYRLDLGPDAQDQWRTIEQALVDWNIKTASENSMHFVPRAEPQLWSMINSIAPGSDHSALDLLSSTVRIVLPFDVRYQLEVCISHGIIEERNVTRDFLLKLRALSAKKVQGQNRARLVLEYAADQKTRIYDPMTLFDDHGAMTFYPPCTHIPPHCALVRKVTVTPTRIYFHTPSLETTNRVLRHYSQLQDNFLRVSFMDELNDGRINGSDTVRDNELYTRAFRVMNNGIRMGCWHWQFLAFGNSQIRENGAFFFCEKAETDVTCNSIRAWMGRFMHIKVVAKYAARLGQCFSTTRLLTGIPAPTIVGIPDVERNGYCFTDGVGKISPILAKKIAYEWKEDRVPSAFQFRLGGCKGVLVLWPEAKDIEVHIRKSQEKFSSEFNGLEIVRLSNYTTATLNRQTISILSCLGVPDQVFMDLLRQELRNYDRAMTDRTFACKLLRQYVDESQSSIMIAEMLESGFMDVNEPYCRAMLQLWRSFSIKYLKEKARIPIADSAFVLGCIDETGTLKGHTNKRRRRDDKPVEEVPEIFLQISDPNNRGDPKVITGVCIVGRNPSLHPGDIRVVKAVDVPALRSLRDVVVFPLQGDRDIPSMCSGGDLDGDDFFVIWNKDLIPNEWFHPPMDFAPGPAKELDHIPTVQDLKVFFALYMKNNSLPKIAHAHLAHADFRDSGAKDPRCVELARLHSKAVDYVKTGVPAELEKKLMPKQFPHFMEKNARKTYRSFKILGQMYDAVNRIQFTPQYDAPFDSRILTRYALDGAMLKKARHLKTQYDTALKRIMGQMQIRTEFEALSAFIMSKPVVGTQFKQHETVRRETDALKQQFKDDCIEAAGGSREFKMLAPFVAAMYQVTHEEVQIALYESRTPHIRKNGKQSRRQIKPESMPLISFPWLFDGILGRIARGSTETEQHVDTTSTGTRKTSSAQPKATTSLDYDGLKNMEYARTSSGIVHRGQILRLFQHEDEDEDEDVANQVEEDLQQPQSQQQQKTRPLIAEHIEERDERLPKDDANATIRINLGLRTSVSPSAPTGPATDKVYNHSEATLPGHRTGGEECSLEQPCLRTQSGEPTAATNTTTSTRVTTSSTEPHSRCFGVPDEDLISFDSPTKPKQLTNGGLDFTTLSASLMDMDGEYPAPLGVQAKEYLHGLLIDFNDGGDRAARSETVNGAIGTEELIPVAGLLDDNNETPTASWSSPIQVSAVKAVSASSSKTVNGTTEQDGDVADDDDLEIEEVFMEKKAASSAFEDLANLGLTDARIPSAFP